MPPRNSTNFRYAITYNNYPDYDEFKIDISEKILSGVLKFACFKEEVGDQGTPHLQGYVEYSVATRHSRCRNDFQGCHVGPARKSAQVNIDYCSKDDPDFPSARAFSYGHSGVGQGKRTDLDSALVTLSESGDIRETALAHRDVYVKFHRGLNALHLLESQQVGFVNRHVTVLFGPSGTGKTSRVYEDNPGKRVFRWEKSQNQAEYALGYVG